jgi:hypothetical protein
MNDGGPAFPQKGYAGPAVVDGQCGLLTTGAYAGMSLRDYFAAAALQGMLSNGFMPSMFCPAGAANSYDYCLAAYKAADAMLEARK